MSSRLGPDERSAALDRMALREHDVVVVGGGVVGTGAALDAVTRGLSTVLLEARDWASGTSSRSSKLIHGGLRYLEMLDFRLVREALQERGLLIGTLAPHLVKPAPFLYPLTHRGWERPYVGTGLLLYDVLARRAGPGRLPHHRHLSRRRALQVAPALRPDGLVGAVQYYDAQVDDARLVVALARTAAHHGALAANRARVVGFTRDGERVTGVQVEDLESGRTLVVRAKQVVNATGVWTDETQTMVGEGGGFRVRASKGIHLVVPRDRIPASTGLILRTDTSVLFVIPWGRNWIIGTTDTDWQLDKAHPAASRRDIDYLLGQLNRALVAPLTTDDVVGVYAGLRPLLAGESEPTSRLSREHVVASPAPGLVVVAGGKYTTYRVMARDAVDAVARGLGGRVPPSRTAALPLVGAEGFESRWDARAELAAAAGLDPARMEHLINRQGAMVDDVLALIVARPDLGASLDGASDYLRAEVVYAAAAEGARHLDDVLTRRTRISIETPDRGVRVAAEAAELMGGVLAWSPDQVQREVAHYVARVDAERESQRMPDDETADAARLGAPEIVPLR